MKLEIYQIGKVPPLTVIECDAWCMDYTESMPTTLVLRKGNKIIAMFFVNNIAGFKEIKE